MIYSKIFEDDRIDNWIKNEKYEKIFLGILNLGNNIFICNLMPWMVPG